MASRQVTLNVKEKKSNGAIVSAGSASGNVIVQFDDAVSQIEIVNALLKVIELIREKEY